MSCVFLHARHVRINEVAVLLSFLSVTPAASVWKGFAMSSLWDKLIVFTLSMMLYLTNTNDKYAVVLVLAAIILTSLESFFEGDLYNFIVFCSVILLSLFVPNAVFFLPLFAYDVCSTRWQWYILLAVIPVIQYLDKVSAISLLFLLSIIILSCILQKKTAVFEKKQYQYNLLRDKITEKQMELENANRNLLEKQDYEVHLATLKERNRIAGELHDSIGHVLTSSLLQTGALIATCKDESARSNLMVLQKSLSSGMDDVRSSIHDLHDDSVDMYDEVRTMIKEFTFCPVIIRYQVDTPPDKKIRYAFLSILKEGFSNIVRHSNATEVSVVILEHPALYQLIIHDNGNTPDGKNTSGPNIIYPSSYSEGMGLPGIKQRVDALGGNVVIRRNQGLEIFVSVPKEMP